MLISLICSGWNYHVPMDDESFEKIGKKNFSSETMKKVNWATKMYREWKDFRNNTYELENIDCDLNVISTISKESLIQGLTRFITEVKKIDGSDFPARTLYDIVICLQFHLETLGYNYRLLNQDDFSEIRFTLDNVMKLRTSQGVGSVVCKAQFLNAFNEELLWSLELLGSHNPSTLLNTIIFILGKGCALRAGKEHRSLRSPSFNSQFEFLHNNEGVVFLRYTEDQGLKTNKGGLKHRKLEPKTVDVYPIEDQYKCPVRLVILYLSKLPRSSMKISGILIIQLGLISFVIPLKA